MINTFLEKTRRGEFTIGTFFEMGQAGVAEILALTDFDYFIVDCEHGPYDIESTADIIRASDGFSGGRMPVFARAKDSSRISILKLLDVGAKGIIIPNVQSLEEAKHIVKVGKYFPIGERGVAVSRSVKYGFGEDNAHGMQAWFDECNEKELIIPQCETKGALEDIEAIVALEGIDGIFVGPYDLSSSLGMPGQFDHPVMVEAMKRIIKAVKEAGKFSIIYADGPENAAVRRGYGYHSVAVALDSEIYFKAMNKLNADVRKACHEEKK